MCFNQPVYPLKLVLAMTALIVLSIGCKTTKKEIAKDNIAQIHIRNGIPVQVVDIQAGTFIDYELLEGTAEGYYQTTIHSSLPGKISKLNVKIGDNVKQDISLMNIEPDLAQNYSLAKTQFETNKRSRDRVMALAEQGGVSQEITDQVATQFAASKEGLDAMHKIQFVPAPFTGTVVNIFQTKNNKISAGDALLTIADIGKIRISMDVSDVLISQFKTGQNAIAVVGSDSIRGFIEKVAMAAQNKTHTFTVEAVFNNPARIIKPGMYIPVKVLINQKDNAITVPCNAVNFSNDGKFVFVVKDSVAKKVIVSTGVEDGERVEITSGLIPGDKVVLSGVSLIADGSKVKIVE